MFSTISFTISKITQYHNQHQNICITSINSDIDQLQIKSSYIIHKICLLLRCRSITFLMVFGWACDHWRGKGLLPLLH